ncbi:type II toxin-antitoxin system RelE/ParE family toxin [bacterium]|nr:type II toxin-antitoxin system RelE/ParE family toxin [bacterium]
MRVELKILEYVTDFLGGLPEELQAKCLRHIELFEEFGFSLSKTDLKKIDRNIWELRPKNIRILVGKAKSYIWAVHAFLKTSQRTPKKEITLANKRLRGLR